MSFKVGDVCEYVDVARIAAMNGAECEIVALVDSPTGEYECRFPGFPSHVPSGNWHCFGRQLRLKRPPPDEFQPAEPEFVSDLLKRLNKVRV